MIRLREVQVKEDVVIIVNGCYPKLFKSGDTYKVSNSKKGNVIIDLNNKHGWVTLNAKDLINDTKVLNETFYKNKNDFR